MLFLQENYSTYLFTTKVAWYHIIYIFPKALILESDCMKSNHL